MQNFEEHKLGRKFSTSSSKLRTGMLGFICAFIAMVFLTGWFQALCFSLGAISVISLSTVARWDRRHWGRGNFQDTADDVPPETGAMSDVRNSEEI